MKFRWIITKQDIKSLNNFVNIHRKNNFVKNGIERNLSDKIPPFSKSKFWKWMVACLLTTQQRSGPNSKISKFMITDPFPLSYELCQKYKNVEEESHKCLTKFGGIRRTNKISGEIKFNYYWLENGGWGKILEISEKLIKIRKQKPSSESIKIERVACLLVQDLKGIGPKQSRNLWQSLGLTRFEIPLDSRVIKWLNKNNFPFILSASGLADENYYLLLMNGIQKLCLESRILPCVLDACIFSSYDTGEWPEDYEL